MERKPAWAEGLVLRADGYECEFYRKDWDYEIQYWMVLCTSQWKAGQDGECLCEMPPLREALQ